MRIRGINDLLSRATRFSKSPLSFRVRIQAVTVKGYVALIAIVAGGQVVATHKRSLMPGPPILDPLHYLPALSHKPSRLARCKNRQPLPGASCWCARCNWGRASGSSETIHQTVSVTPSGTTTFSAGRVTGHSVMTSFLLAQPRFPASFGRNNLQPREALVRFAEEQSARGSPRNRESST